MATSTAESPRRLQFSSLQSFPTIRLWPPNEATRSTLVKRLADHLSSESFFSVRYGRIEAPEASVHAESIEEAAFQAASRHQTDHGGDISSDIAVVQFYAKEASRLMLECLKKGPSTKVQTQETVGDAAAVEMPASKETAFDISNGKREFVTEEAAEMLLHPLTVPENVYSSVCLSNRSFGVGAAMVASRILAPLRSQIVQVNLADIVAGRSEEEALSVMSMFSTALEGCKLKYLNLSDNALGEKGIRAFSELLRSQYALEELYFMNNGISEEAALAICELLPSSEKLRILHFHNNMTGDDGAIALSKLVNAAPILEDFRCSSTRVSTEGGIALADALLAGSRLWKLDLRDNPFGSEGGLALAKTLKQHMNLKEIYFSYLGLEDEGVAGVLEALQSGAPRLEVLELAGNVMTVSSAEKLAECIKSKHSLLTLNVSENELEDSGVVAVCEALRIGHESLVELDLCETNIGRIGACAAAEVVASKHGFKLLGLNGNHISESGIETLKFTLKKGFTGVSVLGLLDENDIDDTLHDDGDGGEDDGNSVRKEEEDLHSELQAQFGNIRV